MPAREVQLDGLLVVDKPGHSGLEPIERESAVDLTSPPVDAPTSSRPYLLSSHDVVARVRRWSGQRRIGHTGTLDPMASGLLLLCLGSATRLVEYYQHQRKGYLAEIVLGAATDTDDAAGTVVERLPVPALDGATIDAALDTLRGTVQQRAPAYSAIKQGGETLYARARRGEAVDAPTRTVTFYAIDLVAFDAPDRLTVRVACTAGAYIRSLARDLGLALGTVAHLGMLRREAIGSFTLEQAHTLEAIEAQCATGDLADWLLPPGAGLPLPAHTLNQDELRRMGFGQIVLLAGDACDGESMLAAAYDEQGQFAGIIRRLDAAQDGESWAWKAEKWLR